MSFRYYLAGAVVALHWALIFLHGGIADWLVAALAGAPTALRVVVLADCYVLPAVGVMFLGHVLDKRRARKLAAKKQGAIHA